LAPRKGGRPIAAGQRRFDFDCREIKMKKNKSTQTNLSVSETARSLWERAGRPDGRDLEFWLAAEKECGVSSTTPKDSVDSAPESGDVKLTTKAKQRSPREENL
jgi:hypothetical protein